MQEVAFDMGEVIVGRDASCELTIEDDSLSRTHAAIRRTDSSSMISAAATGLG